MFLPDDEVQVWQRLANWRVPDQRPLEAPSCGVRPMMMVETELRASDIQGVGIFLAEDVRKGQLLWRFDSRIDRIYSPEEVASLPSGMRSFLLRYTTLHRETGLRVLCGDHGRHFNHSDTPNTVSVGISFGDDIAACDMPAGTELTSDYRTICDEARLEGLDF